MVQPEPRGNDMFLDVNELAVRKLRIKKSYAPGLLDFSSAEFKQAGPLEVRATAELVEGHIRVSGQVHTRLEMPCARCLETVVEELSRDFDLYYRPLAGNQRVEEVQLREGDTEIGFFAGDGLFLSVVLAELVHLQVPMKTICRSDCRGLCVHCGANLNHEECRCESPAPDSRLQPLARWKQDWSKKQ